MGEAGICLRNPLKYPAARARWTGSPMKFFLLWIALLVPAGQAAPAAILEAYLATDFPARIEHIAAGEQEITFRGQAGPDLLLAEFPISDLLEERTPLALTELPARPDGAFSIPLPRKMDGRDRLLSRWQLMTKSGVPASHFHYADDVHCRAPQPPAMKPRSKKGLGGWSAGPYPGELEALGIDAVTVNVVLTSSLANMTRTRGPSSHSPTIGRTAASRAGTGRSACSTCSPVSTRPRAISPGAWPIIRIPKTCSSQKPGRIGKRPFLLRRRRSPPTTSRCWTPI